MKGIKISVKYLGPMQERVGRKTEIRLIPEKKPTVKIFLKYLLEEIPGQNLPLEHEIILVNSTHIESLKGFDTPLKEGDEIVIMPLIAGG